MAANKRTGSESTEAAFTCTAQPHTRHCCRSLGTPSPAVLHAAAYRNGQQINLPCSFLVEHFWTPIPSNSSRHGGSESGVAQSPIPLVLEILNFKSIFQSKQAKKTRWPGINHVRVKQLLLRALAAVLVHRKNLEIVTPCFATPCSARTRPSAFVLCYIPCTVHHV